MARDRPAPDSSSAASPQVAASPEVGAAVAALAHRLLDIGKRNRLIHTPLGKRRAKQLDIEDERADQVFRILAREGRPMSFEPWPKESGDAPGNAPADTPLVPGDAGYGASVPLPGSASASTSAPAQLAGHHTDRKLRTRLTPEALQKRLLSIHREARTLEEEQGVSVLFMAVGFLAWCESESSDVERYAPLLLVPVGLTRDSVRSTFKLRFRDQDIEPNLSLAAMLDADFGITLPELPEGHDWLPSEYFGAVAAATSGKPRWRVLRNVMELSFFSFGKFLMHRDLTADADWGEGCGPSDHPVLGRLLAGGEARPAVLAADERLDRRFPDPRELGHVMDADTSQTQVIAAARDGRNLVVQGPPGTGKSQTITNIVAVAAREGRRVLFVAEKRAALDVVHERLMRCGLGPLCLELHSSKASKSNVYGELARALSLGPPAQMDEAVFARLREVRDDLNRMSDLMHAVDEATGATAYGIIGDLSYWSQETDPPDFGLAGGDRWSRTEWEERIRATEALAGLTTEQGPEGEHPWRGANRRLTEMDRRRLKGHLAAASQALDALDEALAEGERAAGLGAVRAAADGDAVPGEGNANDGRAPRTLRHASWVARHLDALDAMPEGVHQALRSRALAGPDADLLDASFALARDVADAQERRAEVLKVVDEAALGADWTEVALTLRARGRSLLRWLSGDYRRAVTRLRSVVPGELPKAAAARLKIAEGLVDLERRRGAIASREGLGVELFGARWQRDATDVDRWLPALRWLTEQAALLGRRPDGGRDPDGPGVEASGDCATPCSPLEVARQVKAVAEARRTGDTSGRAGSAAHLRSAADAWNRAWGAVVADVGLVAADAFGAEADQVAVERLRRRLAVWTECLGGLDGWHRLRTASARASELGLDELRTRLGDGRLAPAAAIPSLHLVRGEAVWRRMVAETPELGDLDGADRTAQVERFRDLDRQLQRLASHEVAAKHFAGLPTGSSGQIGIVRGEIAKKRRHMPIRKLLDRAGEAVAAIKPVFLMSPLSVAQYLAPGRLRFDLVLIDEASQMRPEDAAGAILRADQIVVVGDQKQLPPTSFFDRQMTGGDDGDDPEDEAELLAAQVGEMESVLSLCEARTLSGGMLRWHYRSRHPSLIQVSNHEFYESRLIFPPSPDAAGRTSGLTLRHVENGCYDRGGRRNNLPEAVAVAEAVLAHARARPDRTLGVVAMSVAQRNTILDQMEWMRARHPELDAFCREGRPEPFFVKNLENVQGDERDAIFVSIGYGRDSGGYMAQSFGPVSGHGGERRLNVLFTRARQRCTIFSSIRHGDIRLDAVKRAGPRVLKRFLKYAETGEMDVAAPTAEAMDSPFEESVARTLARHGYRVAAQVGSAGFRIDLAVHDPDDEGRYLLAIECDGARYHSSSWARERDRLRQAVLEGKGWRFHRIWSTDWFYNRELEVSKLLDAIERARDDGRGAGRSSGPAPAGLDGRVQSKASEPEPGPTRAAGAGWAGHSGAGASRAGSAHPSGDDLVPRLDPLPPPDLSGVPYREAALDIPESVHQKMDETAPGRLARHVERVVAVEGPVHVAEVTRRLSRAWGYARTGSRIRAAAAAAIAVAVREGLVRPAGGADFLDRAERAGPPPVRDRSALPAAGRRVELLPPTELREAIRRVVEGSVSVPVEQCAVDVARMTGYKRTPAGFQALVAREAAVLVAEGALVEVGGELRAG